jgi:hypothetical protein
MFSWLGLVTTILIVNYHLVLIMEVRFSTNQYLDNSRSDVEQSSFLEPSVIDVFALYTKNNRCDLTEKMIFLAHKVFVNTFNEDKKFLLRSKFVHNFKFFWLKNYGNLLKVVYEIGLNKWLEFLKNLFLTFGIKVYKQDNLNGNQLFILRWK